MTQLVSLNELENILSMSRSSVKRLVREDGFPVSYRLGNARRWNLAEIDEWLEQHRDSAP